MSFFLNFQNLKTSFQCVFLRKSQGKFYVLLPNLLFTGFMEYLRFIVSPHQRMGAYCFTFVPLLCPSICWAVLPSVCVKYIFFMLFIRRKNNQKLSSSCRHLHRCAKKLYSSLRIIHQDSLSKLWPEKQRS